MFKVNKKSNCLKLKTSGQTVFNGRTLEVLCTSSNLGCVNLEIEDKMMYCKFITLSIDLFIQIRATGLSYILPENMTKRPMP